MIEETELAKFLNAYVAIGVVNDFFSDRLFFYFGTVKEIDSRELKLRMAKGFKIIPLREIKDVHVTGGG